MPERLLKLPTDRQLFDEAPCGLLVLSTSGLILKANQTFAGWVGFTAEALVQGMKLQELFSMGGRIFHQTHWLPMLEMQGSVTEVKFEIRKRDGTAFPAMLNAIRRRSDAGAYDEVSVVVAQERNQYERELLAARQRADELLRNERQAQADLRISQARLQQAMQIGAIHVWDIDTTTGHRRYGDEVALLLGFDSTRPVDESTFMAMASQLDVSAERAALDRALATAEPFRWTYRIDGVDGMRRVIVASGQAFLDGDGQLAEFVGTLADTTEAYRLREAAEDRALFAEQMVGIVSHDLRNPLQTISLATRMLAPGAGLPPDKTQRVLGNIEGAAKRAQRLITDLLDFTAVRLGAGLTVQRSEVDFHAAIARVLEELALAFPHRMISHRKVGDGVVAADMDRIAQLLGNLVGNAMAYGDAGRPVTVTSSVLPDEARLAVHNWGQPIPAEQQATMFEPMVRGETQDNSVRSVGLGLFIVRAIARAHGGSVNVVSGGHEGTEFTFRFAGAD